MRLDQAFSKALSAKLRVDETTIRMRLFEGLEVDVVGRLLVGDTGTGLRVWSGNVTFLRRGTQVAGLNVPCTIEWNDRVVIANIDLPGGPVRIRTIGSGLHAIFRVDADGLPEEHPRSDASLPLSWNAAGEHPLLLFQPSGAGSKIAAVRHRNKTPNRL